MAITMNMDLIQRINDLEQNLAHLESVFFQFLNQQPSLIDWLSGDSDTDTTVEQSDDDLEDTIEYSELPDLNVLPATAGNCGTGDAQ